MPARQTKGPTKGQTRGQAKGQTRGGTKGQPQEPVDPIEALRTSARKLSRDVGEPRRLYVMWAIRLKDGAEKAKLTTEQYRRRRDHALNSGPKLIEVEENERVKDYLEEAFALVQASPEPKPESQDDETDAADAASGAA